jgi:cysteine-rich repeat protein
VHVFGVNVGSREQLQVRALTPVCGNGRREAGETCDDGNGSNDDRCDGECRQIVATGSQETEPNDNWLQENVVRLQDGAAQLAGQLAGACDVDRYAVRVPEGASLRAAMFGVGGTACDPLPPPVRMRFEDPRNPSVQVSGERRSDTGQNSPCVTLGDASETQNLAAGEYHVIVRTPRETDDQISFVYQLELQVQ